MTRKSNGDIAKYKKSPQAPRRFKSAYMFFSTEKHKEIRIEMGDTEVRVICTLLDFCQRIDPSPHLASARNSFSSYRSLQPKWPS
jgi:hypothetical protein